MVATQLNFLTLACADVERMAVFLRALGWAESSESEPARSASTWRAPLRSTPCTRS
jgi:hypothetical protein